MPPRAMTDAERRAFKEEILAAALELFDARRYEDVSMRAVARRLGCSATRIYNYYRGKDELYLDVVGQGFALLARDFRECLETLGPEAALFELALRYWRFAEAHPRYYDLMFTLPVPKYSDYVGGELEPTAAACKDEAMRCLDLLRRGVARAQAEGLLRSDREPEFVAKAMLSMAHGVISLHRSRTLEEMEPRPERFFRLALLRCLEAFRAG